MNYIGDLYQCKVCNIQHICHFLDNDYVMDYHNNRKFIQLCHFTIDEYTKLS